MYTEVCRVIAFKDIKQSCRQNPSQMLVDMGTGGQCDCMTAYDGYRGIRTCRRNEKYIKNVFLRHTVTAAEEF